MTQVLILRSNFYSIPHIIKICDVSALVYILKYGPSISVVTFYSRLQFCDGVIFSLTQMQPNISLRVWSVQRNYVTVKGLTHSDTKLHLKEIEHSTYCHCAELLPKDSVPKLSKGKLKGSYKQFLVPIQI
jgi:hypothetical protein